MNVTRNIIADLWALSAAGEASEDSQRLVDEYLAADPDFARTLRDERAQAAPEGPVDLPPDHEAQTLNRAKQRLRRRSPLYLLALALTGLAIARVLEDTTFTEPPTRVVATAVMAAICWVLCAWHTRRLREGGLLGRPGPS